MFTIIDSGSQPSIVSSTAALDFSCSRAKREGIGVTYTSLPSSDGSLPTIGHTAYNAANRGLVSIVLVDHPTESASFLAVPGRSQPVVGEADLEGPSTSYARLQAIVQRGLYEQRHSPLVQTFFQRDEGGHRSATDAETLERMLEGATKENAEGTGDDEAGFFTICVDPNHPGNSSEIERTTSQFIDEHAETLTTVYQPSEIRNRGKTLIERGVDIEKDVWEDLFEFSNGIFSPDSVGSETGAGPSLER
jgi:LDH2 family malate/lactate/ureidoglycolate dehydrogenase